MKKLTARGPHRARAHHSKAKPYPTLLPVLPSKDLVSFPSVMMALFVSGPQGIAVVEQAVTPDRLIFIVGQKNIEAEIPHTRDLYKIGVIAKVIRMLKLPDDRYKVLIQGQARARAKRYRRDEIIFAEIELLENDQGTFDHPDAKVFGDRIRKNIQVLVEHEHLPEEMLLVIEDITTPGHLADVILAHYRLPPELAQSLLEEPNWLLRLAKTDHLITDELNRFLVSENIQDKARDELNKGQREYYLREQIRQIQTELGEEDGTKEEIASLKTALEEAKLPKAGAKEAFKQLSRLERMPTESSEYALLRTYLEWITDLPWSVHTRDRLDIKEAKKILDQDHYGLEKAKERILEYLSVRKLNKDLRGPILCFVGPPGVGKTSLGKSIARALNRKFFRMSLGGMRDEAEIRGHRRTYVGALPGRIIQGLKQAGSTNPVFVLDELDKVGTDFRGDPASALLEVLDPHQNKEFRDHYLNINFDLSEVLFIATANTVDTIPEALLDRLEIIYISGYTTEEKEKIARKFIIPRQVEEHGLDSLKLQFSTEAIMYLIERYTLEAGVRNLEREIGSLCRKIAREHAELHKKHRRITVDLITKLLGATKFDPETKDMRDLVGVSRGLAWTVNGGEMMPVEASVAKGNGNLTLTGQLGSIMQESAQAALFYARANAKALGLNPSFGQKNDIHIHVPGGATPKDGPSAGVTIACALVSALSERPLKGNVAMTGEITLVGNVLPVGGLKEKALAALRYGINTIIIPEENIKDLEEIPKEQRDKMKFISVKHVDEVIKHSLLPAASRRRKKR
jgi:ATP-dependent Lon protease